MAALSSPILIFLLFLVPFQRLEAQDSLGSSHGLQARDSLGARRWPQAQDSLGNLPLSLDSALQMAQSGSKDLALVYRKVTVAHQQALISRQARQPEANVGLSEGYLSNSDIWDPDFSNHRVEQLPHLATSFPLAADWTIVAGGRINLAIHQADIQVELASLSAEERRQEIKLLVVLKYLDICRQLNQRKIYLDNAQLAHRRLSEIESLYHQGLVTRNDVLRTQIEINDYELAARQTANAVIRLNTELDMVLGCPDSVRLIPDTSALHAPPLDLLDAYLNAGFRDNPTLKLALTETHAAVLKVAQQKAERLPIVSLFGENDFQRPYVYSNPALDIYYNVWQLGVSIKYDLGSLYHSGARIKGAQLDLEVSRTRDTLTKQQIEVGVRNAYNLCQDSWDGLHTAQLDVASADENYRLVLKKYLNQLALITELIDATNTKIDAEIRVNDATINTMYTYYQLLQTTGSL